VVAGRTLRLGSMHDLGAQSVWALVKDWRDECAAEEPHRDCWRLEECKGKKGVGRGLGLEGSSVWSLWKSWVERVGCGGWAEVMDRDLHRY